MNLDALEERLHRRRRRPGRRSHAVPGAVSGRVERADDGPGAAADRRAGRGRGHRRRPAAGRVARRSRTTMPSTAALRSALVRRAAAWSHDWISPPRCASSACCRRSPWRVPTCSASAGVSGPAKWCSWPTPRPVPVTVTVRRGVRPPVAWDPVTLRRGGAARAYARSSPAVPAGLGSVFLRRGRPADRRAAHARGGGRCDGAVAAHPARCRRHLLPDGPRPWTELGRAAAAFAGVGTYRTEVDVDGDSWTGRAAVPRLPRSATSRGSGSTGSTAVSLWTAPFRVDVTAVRCDPGGTSSSWTSRTPG